MSEKAKGKIGPTAVMIAITRLWTVEGLNTKCDSHSSGNNHSVHHAHRPLGEGP